MKGERTALQQAPLAWKEQVTPLWFIKKRGDLVKVFSEMSDVWRGDQIIDISGKVFESLTNSDLTSLVQNNVKFCIEPDMYLSLNDDSKKHFNNNPVFKLNITNLEDILNSSFITSLTIKLNDLETQRNSFLFIDIKHVEAKTLTDASEVAKIIKVLQAKTSFKIVLCSGAFPVMLDGIIGDDYIARFDKQLFELVNKELKTKLDYSDYCTVNPLWEIDRILRSNHGNIRYTHDNYWLILRQPGRDSSSTYELTQLLCLHKNFRGKDFSWADKNWHLKSKKTPELKPGNSTNHTSEFIHHHIAQVLKYG